VILAIDPGVQKCGAALLDEGRGATLLFAAYVPHTAVRDWALSASQGEELRLVVEMPKIYPGSGQQKGDLNDLLDLAAVVGYLESEFRDSERVYPAQWKGQVPKKIMTARILNKLSPVEQLAVFECGAVKSKLHNVIDAVGIGLWHLGRL
jgi:hypothetical protein